MSRRCDNKNNEFLYFNANYNTSVPQRLIKNSVKVNRNEGKKIETPRDVVNDFLESTSVHGLQYFGKIDIKVGVLGKLLWTGAMLTGFVCLSLMVMQFLNRYNENPTNTYIKSFTAPIFTVPFPAITICPLTPTPLRKQLEVLENAILPENVSRELALHFLKYGRHITLPYSVKTFNNIDKLHLFLEANKWSIHDFLRILQPCEELFESCWWSNERIDCSKFIRFTHSSYGLCCSFNYILEDYVGRDKRQPKINPITSVGYGPWSGLKLVINHEVLTSNGDDYHNFITTMSSDGAGLLIHHCMDFPGLSNNMYVLQIGRVLEVAIQPLLATKPPGMFHRNKNNQLVSICVPDDQNDLEYLPVYRYSNCYVNCRIKAMIHLCRCLPFIFDYLSEYHHYNQCDSDGLFCVHENMKLISIVKDVENENFSCSCRTPCNNLMYNSYPNSIALTQTGFMGNNRNMSDKNAVLKVFMDSQTFQILQTLPAADEIYLLASIGGIFSLFLGCSFLSLVEIIYFAGLLCRAIFLDRKVKSSSLSQRTHDNIVKRRVY